MNSSRGGLEMHHSIHVQTVNRKGKAKTQVFRDTLLFFIVDILMSSNLCRSYPRVKENRPATLYSI